VNMLCIFHGKCPDGFTAAWAVHKAFGDSVDYVAGIHQDSPPDVTGRDVIIVDFSYKRAVLQEIAAKAATVLILDHHKTAQEDLAGIPPPLDGRYNPSAILDWQRDCGSPNALHALFDMDRSGAQIAWDYFHPGRLRPNLVNYVGDSDLWHFKLPLSRAINAVVSSYAYTFENWDHLERITSDDMGLQNVARLGGAIERKHLKDVAELVEATKRRMTIGGHDVPVANVPYTLASDAGHLMAHREPFAACYWDTRDGRVFSLRSTDNGLDVSAIAKQYGGGGHLRASGFRMPIGWEGDHQT